VSIPYGENTGGLVGVLREVVARMKQIGSADLVALYPYDQVTETLYAPMAFGISDEGLLSALPDMADQLRRYRTDAAQGKAPEDLLPSQYGPNIWLIVNRQPLLSEDAAHDINSSFIRRNKIRGVIGLPLMDGNELVALLYLNYVGAEDKPAFPDDLRLADLQAEAARAGMAIDQARKAEDMAALRATASLVGQLSAIVPHAEPGSPTFRDQLESTLATVITATGTDAAAVYAHDSQARRYDLVAAQGLRSAFPWAASVR